MKQWILVAVVAIATGCSKKENDRPVEGTVWMRKAQTQCADAWGYGSNMNETVTRLKNYLQSKGIAVYDIGAVDEGRMAACLACTCRTNFRFDVAVGPMDTTAMEAEGFVR
jgi:hypothetical protein